MAMVIAQADAPLSISPITGAPKVTFFSFPDSPDLPHATMNGHTGNRVGAPHFHVRDQFQVVVDGEFKLGKHQLSPYCIHFSRAYTPYGPLVPKDAGDYTFIVMRAHRDHGAQFVSKEMEQLRSVPDRRPWQVSARASFPSESERGTLGDVALHPISEVHDDYGLAAHTLIMKPDVRASAPDAARGDGQYIVVVKGSLWHEGKEHKAYTLVFVKPEDGAYQIHAGPEGLEAVVVNFPQPISGKIKSAAPVKTTTAFKKWRCELCAFEYDEELGMPAEGVPAGTRWADVPESWSCPDCAAAKSDFQMAEVVEA